jgi:hypothetical protein
MGFGKPVKKIKEKLEKAGDLLLFWCVVFPIFYVLFRWMFKDYNTKIKR